MQAKKHCDQLASRRLVVVKVKVKVTTVYSTNSTKIAEEGASRLQEAPEPEIARLRCIPSGPQRADSLNPDLNCSLSALKGGYIGDFIGELIYVINGEAP